MENLELPKGWIETTLEKITETSSGGTPNRKNPEYFNGSIRWVKSGELNQEVIYDTEEKITDLGLKNSSAKIFPKDTLLIALYGTTVGKLAFLGEEAATNQAVCGITVDKLIEKKYIYYFLQLYRDELLNKRVGSAQPNISQQIVNQTPIPLAPFAEQTRIVAEIETVLTWVSEAQEEMDKIPALLRAFRQKVLAMAVSGDLTKDFRENTEGGEKADELLEYIVVKRRERYKNQCDLAEQEGRKKPRKIYLEDIPKIDKVFLDIDLPKNWALTNIHFLAHVTKLAGFEYTDYFKNLQNEGEVALIRAQNVHMGEFIDDNILYIDKATSNILERSKIHGREILMVFIGAGTGNVCMSPSYGDWHLAPNVAKIDVDETNPKFLNFYLQSPFGRDNIGRFIKATAQPSLSMETIREVEVPIPPLAEQDEIVKRVEALLDWIDSVEAAYTEGVSQLKMLPQSLLHKAFSGQLVPQDPTDEPASVLLERIQAEKKRQAEATKKDKKVKSPLKKIKAQAQMITH
jgi:type I restriction enzyme, S subunit